MATNPKRETVTGVFEDRETAAKALEKLTEAQFDIEADASVTVSHGEDQETVPILSDVPVARGAMIGAAVGAALGAAVVTIAGLDFGPFSMEPWGRVWAAFETAYVAACIGVATGAMMSFEFAEPEPAFDTTRLKEGIVSVGVRAAGARAERARQILIETGAKPFPDHRPEMAAA